MLFAVTSSMVWWTVRPLMAENIARMVMILSGRSLPPMGVRRLGPFCGWGG
jgi:hypothetical protein